MTKLQTSLSVQEFHQHIYAFYAENKRSFAWRYTDNPYHVFISEIMLQQTQTDRVRSKFDSFLEQFPTLFDLAQASLSEVLTAWQGLGYNRRAKFLHHAAQLMCTLHDGAIPKNPIILKQLPGIGAYTSRSIATFAYNIPTVFIETNIRAVFIHLFFNNQTDIHDKELFPLIEKYLDINNPRSWYYALMDYGSFLKKQTTNPNRKSVHYAIQSKFEGSDRQIRGAIIRILTQHKKLNKDHLFLFLKTNPERTSTIIEKLLNEGLIQKTQDGYTL